MTNIYFSNEARTANTVQVLLVPHQHESQDEDDEGVRNFDSGRVLHDPVRVGRQPGVDTCRTKPLCLIPT